MKKIILLILIFQTSFLYYGKIISGELKVTSSELNNNFNYKKAYFAGGCFWCMEESFDKVDGLDLGINFALSIILLILVSLIYFDLDYLIEFQKYFFPNF